ncbi:ADP-ribose pyrophosphatase [Sphaerisporangium melleum]|uniref:ADP-ribose pyrophosphatase n=1 Tax=Sphaerisporangium melleum TaxID=321316 RepID=A0A917VNS0_9ACTN|nr:NUDIX hydrolase [Sphaerisporangium melleum]GGL03636.1 ADP-ribose pyrophosphatase [Sphaerisporangium melleum]GII74037.1 ADP-ribose pyrophosphatase [Sphaerisporangium melleum]
MAEVTSDEFFARINKTLASAGALITDPQGRVLLVKPNYRDHWLWPGGHVEEDETPDEACGRELTEELGVALPVGRLLGVHWVPPFGDRPLPMVHFLFDCGELPGPGDLVLQEEELDAYGFFAEDEVRTLVPAYLVRRLRAALAARRDGTSFYLTGGSPDYLT